MKGVKDLLFTRLRGTRILRTSPVWNSAKFALCVRRNYPAKLAVASATHCRYSVVDRRALEPTRGDPEIWRRCWLLHSGLGLYAHRLGRRSAQDTVGHPRPAHHQ